MASVHSVAQTGFGSGTNELYDRARPSYQPLALSYIRDAIKGTAINIVEVGSGTGIFTRALLAHPDWSSAVNELRAIEPSEGMRDRVSTSEGTFEQTGIEDGWADLVVVAQAFHWCPDFERASAEFARILKPSGVLGLIWNLEDRFRLGLWRQAVRHRCLSERIPTPAGTGLATRALPANNDIVVDRACSKSYVAVLSEEEKEKVKDDLRAIIERGEEKVWINESEGTFEYPYKTYAVIAHKK
ncbi:S-adenosyl-L-methionine-dependent methyltransferase [Mycena rebaudengoi]|nr:S-adenosyl-L-methionine-dependent methyltransferase [Mycena rebaudengoi]